MACLCRPFSSYRLSSFLPAPACSGFSEASPQAEAVAGRAGRLWCRWFGRSWRSAAPVLRAARFRPEAFAAGGRLSAGGGTLPVAQAFPAEQQVFVSGCTGAGRAGGDSSGAGRRFCRRHDWANVVLPFGRFASLSAGLAGGAGRVGAFVSVGAGFGAGAGLAVPFG